MRWRLSSTASPHKLVDHLPGRAAVPSSWRLNSAIFALRLTADNASTLDLARPI
jgi:hypothetical protein